MALKSFLILSRPPPGPRFARPEDKLRGRVEGRTAPIQRFLISSHPASPEGAAGTPARRIGATEAPGAAAAISRFDGNLTGKTVLSHSLSHCSLNT